MTTLPARVAFSAIVAAGCCLLSGEDDGTFGDSLSHAGSSLPDQRGYWQVYSFKAA